MSIENRCTTPVKALLICLVLMTGACTAESGADSAKPPRTPPPPPTPALSQAQVKTALMRFTKQANHAHRELDRRLASAAYAGSSLEMEIAKYKVFTANQTGIKPARYGQVLGASPKFSAHPKWFFAAMTDRKARPPVREVIVFVQEGPGKPWLAAYTPLTTKPVTGPLARGVDVADHPDVVAPDDTSLVVPPGRVSAALADVLNRGSKAPHIRSFDIAPWMKTKYRNLQSDRSTFKKNGWSGSAAYGASRFPVYAARTKSGGALVWTAVELKEQFRHTRRGDGITWRTDGWGDLLRPFTGRSRVTRALTSVERIEVLAYVPPKGKGRIRLLANRWAPITIRGR